MHDIKLEKILIKIKMKQTIKIKSNPAEVQKIKKLNAISIKQYFPFLSARKSSKSKQKKAANISDFVQQNLNVSNSNRKNSRIGGAISNIVKFTKEEIDAYNKKFNFDKKQEYLQKLANLNQNVFSKEKLAESITVNNKKINKPIYPTVQNLRNDSHNFKIEAWKPQPTELDDIPNIT